jgi:hypothetical protein
MSAYPYKMQVEIVMASMTLYNYIRKRSHDDVAFVEFDRNPILFMIIFYLMLLHTQEAMKTVGLVGWVSYVMELQIV